MHQPFVFIFIFFSKARRVASVGGLSLWMDHARLLVHV